MQPPKDDPQDTQQEYRPNPNRVRQFERQTPEDYHYYRKPPERQEPTSQQEGSMWRDWWKQLTIGLTSLVLLILVALVTLFYNIQNTINLKQDAAIDAVDKRVTTEVSSLNTNMESKNERVYRTISDEVGKLYIFVDKQVTPAREENDRQRRLLEELRNIQSERKAAIDKVYKLEERFNDLERRFYSLNRGVVSP